MPEGLSFLFTPLNRLVNKDVTTSYSVKNTKSFHRSAKPVCGLTEVDGHFSNSLSKTFNILWKHIHGVTLKLACFTLAAFCYP